MGVGHRSGLQHHMYLIVGRKMLKEKGKVSTCAALEQVDFTGFTA